MVLAVRLSFRGLPVGQTPPPTISGSNALSVSQSITTGPQPGTLIRPPVSARMVTVGVFPAAEISTFPPVSSSGLVLRKWVSFWFEEVSDRLKRPIAREAARKRSNQWLQFSLPQCTTTSGLENRFADF